MKQHAAVAAVVVFGLVLLGTMWTGSTPARGSQLLDQTQASMADQVHPPPGPELVVERIEKRPLHLSAGQPFPPWAMSHDRYRTIASCMGATVKQYKIGQEPVQMCSEANVSSSADSPISPHALVDAQLYVSREVRKFAESRRERRVSTANRPRRAPFYPYAEHSTTVAAAAKIRSTRYLAGDDNEFAALMKNFKMDPSALSAESRANPFYDRTPWELYNPRLYAKLPSLGVTEKESDRIHVKFDFNTDSTSTSEEDLPGMLDHTMHAQRLIAESQLPPQSIRDAAAKGPKEYDAAIDKWCSEEKLLVVELPDANTFGMGAMFSMLSRSLGHAMLLKRKLVLWPKWLKYTGTPGEGGSHCFGRGIHCWLIPPSPCIARDHVFPGLLKKDPKKGQEYSSIKSNANIKTPHWEKMRVVIRKHFRNRDLRLTHLPDLLPSGVTPEQLAQSTNMTVDHWAHVQLVRYLLRSLQPWAADMFWTNVKRASFPWLKPAADSGTLQAPYFVAATHHRNGEAYKDHEIGPFMKCNRVDPSIGLILSESMARSLIEEKIVQPLCDENHKKANRNASGVEDAGSPTSSAAGSALPSFRLFYSFDRPVILEEADVFWSTFSPAKPDAERSCFNNTMLAARNVLTANFPRPKALDGADARVTMRREFGSGHVAKISLVNLFLSSSADAWVCNRASNWCAIIDIIRKSIGDDRHRDVFVDTLEMTEDNDFSHIIQKDFCNSLYKAKKPKTPVAAPGMKLQSKKQYSRGGGAIPRRGVEDGSGGGGEASARKEPF